MISPRTRSFLRGVWVVAVLAVVAVPLSNLMVAGTGEPQFDINTLSQSELTPEAINGNVDSEASSALSVLMARSAVGAAEDDNYLDLRRPASAFAP